MTTLAELIRQRIRQDGPLPLATYADLALYHPELGYYARADRRSGRAGDFFTSADLGPVFGELIVTQLADMWHHLGATPRFDVVEAAAGDGRFARDMLDAAARLDARFYDAIRLHLVERSPAARAAQRETLGSHAGKLVSSATTLPRPQTVRGVVFANELLDALPPHAVVMTADGLREVYVDADDTGRFVERLGPLSSPRVRNHLETRGITLEPGWRAEIVPDAVDWVRDAVAAVDRGFILLIDYGHEADTLYAPSHATGTLTTYHRHRAETTTPGTGPSWLIDPGSRDITAHVDLTAVRETAEATGAVTLGLLDQTYFLLALGIADRVAESLEGDDLAALRSRLALKSLFLPGGLGSTQKVMLFGRRVGTPTLAGCAFRVRAT